MVSIFKVHHTQESTLATKWTEIFLIDFFLNFNGGVVDFAIDVLLFLRSDQLRCMSDVFQRDPKPFFERSRLFYQISLKVRVSFTVHWNWQRLPFVC